MGNCIERTNNYFQERRVAYVLAEQSAQDSALTEMIRIQKATVADMDKHYEADRKALLEVNLKIKKLADNVGEEADDNCELTLQDYIESRDLLKTSLGRIRGERLTEKIRLQLLHAQSRELSNTRNKANLVSLGTVLPTLDLDSADKIKDKADEMFERMHDSAEAGDGETQQAAAQLQAAAEEQTKAFMAKNKNKTATEKKATVSVVMRKPRVAASSAVAKKPQSKAMVDSM